MNEPTQKNGVLSFADYLGQLPPELVFSHLLAEKKQHRRIVSASAVRGLAEKFSGGQVVMERFAALTPQLKYSCALAYLSGATGLKTTDLNGFDDKLLSSFLVYAAESPDGGLSYVGFDEFAGVLVEASAALLAKRGAAAPGRTPHSVATWSCLNDVAVVAGLAAAGLLKRTKGGTFSKQTSTTLDRLLHASQNSPAGGTLGWPSMLLEYCVRQGILHFDDNAYGANHTAMVRWLSSTLEDRHRDLVEFGAAYTGMWRLEYLKTMLARSGDTWLSTARFPEAVRPLLRDAARVLSYAGLAGLRADGPETAFGQPHAASAQPNVDSRITILPDFSAVIPQETHPDGLYWFLRLGTLSSLDRIYRGAIERAIINESLCQGIRGDDLLGRLTSWQAPHNVVETVREWIREFSRVSLSSETILISADEKVSHQLGLIPALQQNLEPIAAHRVFRVRPHARKQVEEILFSLGFDPRTPLLPADDLPEANGGRENSTPPPRPVLDFAPAPRQAAVHLRSGKYSSELKALDVNEMLHVLDYAILMGNSIRIRYGGSTGVKAGVYRLRPQSVERGAVPVLHCEGADNGTRRRFLIKDIQQLAVEEA